MDFWQMIRYPLKSLQKTKKNPDPNRAFLNILVSSILIGVSSIVMLYAALLAGMWNVVMITALSSFASVVLISIIFSFVVGISAVIMTERGKYISGLAAVAHAFAPVSVGFLLMAIISLLPYAGVLLGGIVMIPFIAMGLSMLYKSVKEIYKTDMVTALIVVSVAMLTMIVLVMFMGTATMMPMAGVV